MQPTSADDLARRTLAKIAWRLIPFMVVLYIVAFLDRVNIGFAALTMNADLGLTSAMFGLASGIFFLGYALFEVPSNVILERVGARVWIARIMITWGLLSAATAFVSGPNSLYALRFALGVAEAGFFPGMILYLTYWFPASSRARILSAFMVALPISSVIGGPLSTSILSLDAAGLRGWQWLFVLEGIPAVLLGFAVLLYLRDGPSHATWLTDDERRWLEGELARERASLATTHRLGDAFREPRVWFLSLIYFGMAVGLYGLGFWLPQIIKGLGGLSNAQVGFVAAVPYAVAAIAMCVWGRYSDRSCSSAASGLRPLRKGRGFFRAHERQWHIAIPLFVGAAGLAASAQFGSSPALALAALVVSAVGIFAAVPVFWTLPTSMLTGSAAAAGIALINSIGNTGGFLGPTMMGYVKETTGSYSASLWMLGAFMLASGLSVIALRLRGGEDAPVMPAQLHDERA